MDYMTIDGIKVPIEGEKNILSLIRKAGIDIPTFCYHSDLSIYGACRMCVVRDDETGRVFASCSERPHPGMAIHTNTKSLQQYRKLIIELLLASHCRDCTTCTKNGMCELQSLAYRVGVHAIRFLNNKKSVPIDMSSSSIVLDPNKCILCGDCVRTCKEVQGIGALEFADKGARMEIRPKDGKQLCETDCVGCGQCAVACPTAALSVRTNVTEVWDAIADPNIRVVAQIAPAVRVAIGDKFNLPKGENSMGKLVKALRIIGFDAVYDTNFGADLTVIEESKEFMKRLESGQNLPMFTSCCPGWVKFCETKYPDIAQNISTCRSPMSMFSPIIKEYFAKKDEAEGKKTYIVAIMPCTAKKAEIHRPDNHTNGRQDTDIVITTQEIVRMIKQVGIKFEELQSEAADMPFGMASGGASIFGVSGGVTEAILRHTAAEKGHATLESIKYSGIRGNEGFKEATAQINGKELKFAVVHGLQVAGQLIEKIQSGEAHYDFVEVMACRRGCILGGGQPIPMGPRTRSARTNGLYEVDRLSSIRYTDDNPLIKQIWDDIIDGREHELLHRAHD